MRFSVLDEEVCVCFRGPGIMDASQAFAESFIRHPLEEPVPLIICPYGPDLVDQINGIVDLPDQHMTTSAR